jgi:cobalt/nickel transport system permease protein
MHISEGILSTPIIVVTTTIIVPLIALIVKKIENKDITKVAMMSGLFFISSFIHIPLGFTSIHLVLSGLIGAVLGLNAILAIFIALIFQALFFGYGGISTLGINTLIIALPALIAYKIYLSNIKIKYFLIGFIPILVSSILLNLSLILNGEEFITSAKIIFLSNIPLMFLEGFITLFIFRFLSKAKVTL